MSQDKSRILCKFFIQDSKTLLGSFIQMVYLQNKLKPVHKQTLLFSHHA